MKTALAILLKSKLFDQNCQYQNLNVSFCLLLFGFWLMDKFLKWFVLLLLNNDMVNFRVCDNQKSARTSYKSLKFSFKLCCQRAGIAAGGEFIVRPARNCCPIENIKLKLTTKSQIEKRPAGTKVQRCKQPKFQRPAPLAAIPMLAVVFVTQAICELEIVTVVSK